MAGCINGGDRDCPFASTARQAVGPIQPYVMRTENFLPGVKRLEGEANHSPPYSARLRMRLYNMVFRHRDSLTCIYNYNFHHKAFPTKLEMLILQTLLESTY
jgi:hypothetical protein